jgi:AraC-like DNA-binding protein
MVRDERELNWQRFQQHEFPMPAPDLARYVAFYWSVKWDYARPYRQKIVPYPHVHLSFRDGVARNAAVHGVSSGHIYKELTGSGRVFGVAVQPGGFRPFLGAPVRSITDRSVPAADVFRDLPDEAEVHTVDAMLRANLPARDPRAELAQEIVNRIIAEPAITRIDGLAERVGLGVRQLQRLFAEHVGVGPKWVIRRYRLREVTERMAAGTRIDWAALAHDLGYTDQPHFVRDFTGMFGESPTRYAARY